ncbi:hypothetical protein F5883DRAFT_178502 [Diaporthe sp. PMI_573]|nr:hypothetical protein F5883DRAFT_178502 [Diaporthaceae sp. PMI_573]
MSNQSHTLHLSYLDCDTTGAVPTIPDLDESHSLIDPSMFEKEGNNNAPLQNNVQPIEARPSPGISLAGAMNSLTFPMQYLYKPFPSNEAIPMESTEWPAEYILRPQTGSGSSIDSIMDTQSRNDSISDLQGYTTRETSLASPTTDLGQCEYGPGWLLGNSYWTPRKSIISEQSEKSFNSRYAGPSTVPTSDPRNINHGTVHSCIPTRESQA